jgi:hypothetical protein
MRLLIVTALLAMAACASPAATPTGGIEGTVTAGPTCPVEIQGSPCPPQVWTGTVRATRSDGTVVDARTDLDGHFRLVLEPGTYSVVALVGDPGPPSAIPVDVTVGDTIETVDLQVDTGIR